MSTPAPISVELTAAIVALDNDTPLILVRRDGKGTLHLPSGPFDPAGDRTLEQGLRRWVKEQIGLSLGYVEQLYTFGDRGRHMLAGEAQDHTEARPLSIGYLALTRIDAADRDILNRHDAAWRDWYDLLPWEDWRNLKAATFAQGMVQDLQAWLSHLRERHQPLDQRAERIALAYEPDQLAQGHVWDIERVLERFELLYEAGLTQEARRDGRKAWQADQAHEQAASSEQAAFWPPGLAMAHDHRRILATAMARLRGKLQYRPILFDLMDEAFTLGQLQAGAEGISGHGVHKQNFRRSVNLSGLVEPTGGMHQAGKGRPAALYHLKRNMREPMHSGIRLGLAQR